MKGQVPVGFVVTKGGLSIDEATLNQEIIQSVRDKLGPIANLNVKSHFNPNKIESIYC